jgi:hypothetical protein
VERAREVAFSPAYSGFFEPITFLREAAMIRLGKRSWIILSVASLVLWLGRADSQQAPPPAAQNPYLKGSEGYGKGPRGLTSFQPIAIDQPFAARMAQDVAAKAGIEREHQALLDERYDLADHPAQGVTMERGKPLQEGVRVKLSSGVTWEQLAGMSPDATREQGLWPKGFPPCRIPSIPLAASCFRSRTSTRSSSRTHAT